MANITITDLRTLPGDSAFLLDDGKTAIVYDTGFGFTGQALAENIQAALGNRPLDYIFLTHSHYDHVLGSAHVARIYPGVKIVAAEYAAEVFARPSARDMMRQLDRRVAKLNAVEEYEDLTDRLRVDIAVKDGDTLTCGELVFTVIGLPGHTKCSIGFYLPEEKLLLGTETLGVFFGGDRYLPSYLVGYQMTLEGYRKIRRLDIRRMLLPHYGVVDKEGSAAYLDRAEAVSRETARTIKDFLLSGKTREEIAAILEKTLYSAKIAPTYPLDAFRLNTDFMIRLIQKEQTDP